MLAWKSGWNLLRPLEVKILDRVCAALPVELRVAIESQISQVKKVQRLLGAIEVDLYYKRFRNGKIRVDKTIHANEPEALLATVALQSLNQPAPISCSIWVVTGHIFMLEFSEPSRKLKADDVEIKSVKLGDAVTEMRVL
ncbi:MAG: hypothetical protein ACIAQF_03800 [Phycisphaerales bacterium JB065]